MWASTRSDGLVGRQPPAQHAVLHFRQIAIAFSELWGSASVLVYASVILSTT